MQQVVDGRCQNTELWMEPGVHMLEMDGRTREVRVKAGEQVHLNACP